MAQVGALVSSFFFQGNLGVVSREDIRTPRKILGRIEKGLPERLAGPWYPSSPTKYSNIIGVGE